MDSHEKYAALLDAFIDGELSAREADEVRAHLSTCAECQAYVADALAMRDAFPDIEETVVPDGFREGVLSALPPRRNLWRTRWTKVVLPLAACLTVFLLVRGTVGKRGGAAVPPANSGAYGAGASDSFPTGGASGSSANSGAYDAEEADSFLNGGAYDAGMSNSFLNGGAGVSSAYDTEEAVSTDADAGVTHGPVDDADTMPEADNSAMSRKSAADETANATTTEDTVSFSMSTDDAPQSTEPGETVPVPEPVPADSDSPGLRQPLGGFLTGGADALPVEEAETEAELQSVTATVWTLPAEALPLLDGYAPAGETETGLWYALTADEFDALVSRLAETDMEASAYPDGAPPVTFPGAAYYVFVPL